MSTKRNYIQGIRGIAILQVLVFHLKPNSFPNGFIGVDMFFVLSGYLMTMILSKKKLNATVLRDFYARRFKRIVPLFVCILTGVYIFGWFYLMEIDRLQLLTDLKWSLTFTTNMQPMFEVKEYWDQVLSYRFLVHCWSLGVEIQFYVIAPFILGYCRQQKWNYLVYTILVCSFIFQLLSPPKIAYGMLLSRIWQFLCGTLAFDIEKRTLASKAYKKRPEDEMSLLEDEEPMKNKSAYLSLIYTVMRELLPVSSIATAFINSDILGRSGMRYVF